MSKLPQIDRPINELRPDATPDGKYAIRILKCYLERSRTKFVVNGMEDNEVKLFEFMNACQDKRVVELEKAIRILEGKE